MKHDTPLFSIITITYNAANELPATMRSVAEQSFTDFEHLIIDGASKDNTLEVAKSLGTEMMTIYREPDKGLYDAMNKGLAKARGEYLIFLNAGDAFHAADTLQKMAIASKSNPDIIYGDTDLVDAQRRFVAKRHLSAPKQLTFDSFKRGMLVCHQAFVVRRELAPSYNLQYRFSADYEWCLRCLRKSRPGKCVNLDCVVIDYLTDGLTDKNHKASLMERYRIMSDYYGNVRTLLFHLSFVPRYVWRKIRQK